MKNKAFIIASSIVGIVLFAINLLLLFILNVGIDKYNDGALSPDFIIFVIILGLALFVAIIVIAIILLVLAINPQSKGKLVNIFSAIFIGLNALNILSKALTLFVWNLRLVWVFALVSSIICLVLMIVAMIQSAKHNENKNEQKN